MSDQTPSCTLDHIEMITVEGEPFDEPMNEYWALVFLWRGLQLLSTQVSAFETTVRSRLDPTKKYFIAGKDPALSGIPMDLLSNYFHWYSVSACQYVRTVGAIGYIADNTRCKPPEYVKAVIPDVLVFRDKVAAHFAWTSKNERDNPAERAISIMPQITWNDDRFKVSGLVLARADGNSSSDSSALKPWSLTETHEQLRQRYWPAT